MSELPLLIPLSPILSLAHPLLDCLPLFISSPCQHFFFFFWVAQALKASLSLSVALSLDPRLALTTAYLQHPARVLLLL